MIYRRIALTVSIIVLQNFLISAGMYETEEQIKSREAAEQRAQRTDERWQARGEAAIPDIIRSLCSENADVYLRDKAARRLEKIGLPVIRSLLKKDQRLITDSLCSNFNGRVDAIASVYCNADQFNKHGSEWDTSIALLRKKADENPDEALWIISAIASLRDREDCYQFESLIEKCLPIISSILRKTEGKGSQDAADTRLNTLNVIASLGPSAASLMKEIIPFLSDPHFDIAAAEALEKIGPSASIAVKEFHAALLRDTAAAKELSFVKALGSIGPAALSVLPDIKRLVEKLIDNAGDGKNRQQLEIEVKIMCKLASSSNDIGARFYKWRTGCSNRAIVGVLKRELDMARTYGSMPVRSICESMAMLGKSGASASDKLLAFVRDPRENIETRGAAAMLIETTGISAKLSQSDRQMIKEVLDLTRPRPEPQVPGPYYYGIPDSSTIPSR
jgi:hypothetical protein